MDEPRLDNLLDGFVAPVDPPPGAAAARIRGERIRRRRQAGAVVAAAAAVAALAVPVGLLGRGGTAAPLPADAPASVVPPRLELPDAFPLTEGVEGAAETDAPQAAPTELRGCGRVWWEPAFEPQAVVLEGATWSPPTGGGTRQRFVTLYPNAEDAAGGYAELSAAYQQCDDLSAPADAPTGFPGGEPSLGALSLIDAPYPGADESTAFTISVGTGGASRTTVVTVVRTGNLVYTALYDVGGRIAAGERAASAASQAVVDAMAPFRDGTVELDAAAEVTESDLLSAEDVPEPRGATEWSVDPEPLTEPALVCQPADGLDGLEATTVLGRRLDGVDGQGESLVLRETVLEHDSQAAAVRSLTRAARWTGGCDVSPVPVSVARPIENPPEFVPPRSPDVPAGTSVDLRDGGDGSGRILEVGGDGGYAVAAVARVGDRVVLVGLDSARPLSREAADRLLRAAADRMVGLDPGAAAGADD